MALFNGEFDPSLKFVEDYEKLHLMLEPMRTIWGIQVVATIGSWDMLHIGHLRYLSRASKFGKVLVVGVDTDEGIKKYKGPDRPVVPFAERCEMLTYQACVDFVTGVVDVDERGAWTYGLLRVIRPDVFVAVEDSYPPKQRRDIKKYVKQLVVLPRQAEDTSTSKYIQGLIKPHAAEIKELGRSDEKQG